MGKPGIRCLAAAWVCLVLGMTAIGQEKVDPAAVRQYNLAVALQKKKLFPQAAQKWSAYIQAFPADPKLPIAFHNLGICQWQDKKLPEAVASFRTVLTRFPAFKSLDASQFQLAVVLQEMALASKKPDDFKAAAAAFAEVPAKYPQSEYAGTALYNQGESLYAAADLPGAAAAYEKLIAGYPMSDLLAEAHYALATVQEEQAKDPAATTTYQAFLQKFPQHRQANECRLRLGLTLFRQKKFPEAEALFTQLATIADFEYADFALLRQAQCQFERGQVPQAAALYTTLPTKFPKSKYIGAAQLAAGECFYQAAQYPAAQTALTAAVALKGDEAPEAAYWLGRTLIKLMKAPEALAALDAAIAAYPMAKMLPDLKFARVDAIAEVPARLKETPALYLAVAQQHPDHELAAKAVYSAALVSLKVEDYPGVQTQTASFLANPKFAKHPLLPDILFLSGEGFLLATPADPAKAEPLYRRQLTEFPMHPQVPQTQVRVGLCLLLSKKYPETVAWLTPVAAALKDPALLAEARLLIGRSHVAVAGQGAQAIAAFQASLQAKPDWDRADEVTLALGLALKNEKMAPQAAVELNRLIAAYPKSTYRDQAYYQVGEIAFADKKYDEAIAHYGQVVTQYAMSPLAPLAQYGIVASHFAKDDPAQTVAAATKLLTTWPKLDVSPRAQYVRGLAQQRLKQYDPALKDLQEFVASKPPQPEALDARYTIGVCQAALKQYDPAVATWNGILAEKPDYPQADKAYYEMGFALLEAKKDKEAADSFRNLATKLPMSPLAPESWFRVGEFHVAAKQLPEAIQAYTKGLAIAKVPELREKLQYKLGASQYEKEQFAEAAVTLLAQLAEHPKGPLAVDAAYTAGEAQFRQNKFAEAVPLFAQVIAAKPEKYHARALYRSGTCQAQLKQWPASQQDFSTLVQLFPKFELVNEARYGMGFALQNQNKFSEAVTVYDAVTKATDTETAAKSRFMIGEIAFSQKNFKEAIEHFLEAAVGYPYEEWQALGFYEAGRCFAELKEIEKARDSLQTVVTKYPKHPRAKDAAALLATLK